MSAPLGNQFWKLRASHGRELIFSSPTILWEAACEYFEATDARKWIKKDWVGKDAVEVERPNETPYTLTGLFVFLDTTRQTWDLYRKREDYIAVIARIEQIIYTQKIEGASVGAFNASIVARELGLKDATDLTTQGEKINSAPVFNIGFKQANDEADPG